MTLGVKVGTREIRPLVITWAVPEGEIVDDNGCGTVQNVEEALPAQVDACPQTLDGQPASNVALRGDEPGGLLRIVCGQCAGAIGHNRPADEGAP